MAKWALGQVLLSRLPPVPSYGFDLGPVLAHCVAARRQWRFRRTATVLLLAWITSTAPFGATVSAAGSIFGFILSQPTMQRRQRLWRGRAWVAAGAVVLPPVALVALDLSDGLRAQILRFTWLAAAGLLGVRIVDRLIAFAYAKTCARRPRIWPLGRTRRRLDRVERDQHRTALPYELYETSWRFIGAGKSPWGRHTISVKLQGEKESPDDAQRRDFKRFSSQELLDAVREDLEDLRVGESPLYPLPCEVREIRGIPDRQWAQLAPQAGLLTSRAPNPADTPRDDPAVSGRIARNYLLAQTTSWSGQLVVTVLASVAIEGRELHFVIRPHVLSPLYDEVEEAVGPPALRPIRHLPALPLQAVGDLAAGLVTCWRFLKWRTRDSRTTQQRQDILPAPRKQLPVSLRERYSPVYTPDMHVSEDAVRHVEIMQARMLATVQEFLEAMGVDVSDFKRQAQSVMTVIHTHGDNNIIQTVTAGRDVRGTNLEADRSNRRPVQDEHEDHAKDTLEETTQ